MEKIKFTEEQKKKFKVLQRKFAWKMAWKTVQLCLSVFLASTVVALIDYNYVHSKGFVFLGSAISGFLIFRNFHFASEAEYAKVREEIKKILQQ